jgi:hypothetical protein
MMIQLSGLDASVAVYVHLREPSWVTIPAGLCEVVVDVSFGDLARDEIGAGFIERDTAVSVDVERSKLLFGGCTSPRR